LRRAGAASGALPSEDSFCAHGFGRHLGLAVRWRLRCAADGSFAEEVSASKERVAWSWGFDAGSGEVWESDAAGCASLLELDDRELLLAASLVRSGHWLRPQAGALLELSLDDGCVDEALEEVAREPLAALVPPGLDCARLRLRVLPHRLLDARLAVCRATGRAVALTLRVGCDAEAWVYGGWAAGSCLPGLTAHASACGALDLYRTDGTARAPLPAGAAQPPAGSLGSQAGAEWLGERCAQPLAVERSGSGHLLVRMQLGGGVAGLAILDTGASGFVVCRAAADAAGAEAFGAIFVAGVGSKLASRYRRCASVTVGPLRFQAPLMLELELAGLVWGASGPVIGIVGFDLFRRAVVHIPPPPGRSLTLAPALPEPPAPAPPPAWLAVSLLSNVPHVHARWHGLAAGAAELLMLDTGAGGADCIFHARTVARLGMGAVGTYLCTSSLRGVAASEPARGGVAPAATQRRRLDWVEVLAGPPSASEEQPGCVRFEQIDALMLGTPTTFDLSITMSGVVAMPLVARFGCIVDLHRRRVGLFTGEDIAADTPAPYF